jgi:hypothetical protein
MEQGSGPRKCYRCGEPKPAEEFAWRRKAKGQRDSFCRPCRSAYGREHYVANRQRYIDQAAMVKRRLRHERTLALIEYFRTHPCVQCGEADPVVLEFDHVRDKAFDIGQNLLDHRWEAIVERSRNARSSARTVIAAGQLNGVARSGWSSPRRWRHESGRPGSNRHFKLGRLTCDRYTTPA